jgi:hypothetical protein
MVVAAKVTPGGKTSIPVGSGIALGGSCPPAVVPTGARVSLSAGTVTPGGGSIDTIGGAAAVASLALNAVTSIWMLPAHPASSMTIKNQNPALCIKRGAVGEEVMYVTGVLGWREAFLHLRVISSILQHILIIPVVPVSGRAAP